MRKNFFYIRLCYLILLGPVLATSCTKLVTVPPPRNTITTEQLFASNEQAEEALAGIYSAMINDVSTVFTFNAATRYWSAGLTCLLGGLSADEFYYTYMSDNLDMREHSTNKLKLQDRSLSGMLWSSAYQSIYGANSIIEGIAASTSPKLTATARKEITAEAKFIRAMAYFNLINFYGDVPLVMTVNFHETIAMRRTPVESVYRQIIEDLNEAWLTLGPDYAKGKGERVRPNKWAAAALLARVHLYKKDYNNAYRMAGEVIGQQQLFSLPVNLDSSFLANNREAIWQLKQTTQHNRLGNATPYGYQFAGAPTLVVKFRLHEQLVNAFETGDKRRAAWIGQTDNTATGLPAEVAWYPAKYKLGMHNFTATTPKEYFMVFRLAEMYLIRAEARAHGAEGGLGGAIADLNVIRHRAGLEELPGALAEREVLAAIEKERRLELFGEWAHRWFDLKRTGRAETVLSEVPMKLPWAGDFQLLYPIPENEVIENSNLIQNEGYF